MSHLYRTEVEKGPEKEKGWRNRPSSAGGKKGGTRSSLQPAPSRGLMQEEGRKHARPHYRFGKEKKKRGPFVDLNVWEKGKEM